MADPTIEDQDPDATDVPTDLVELHEVIEWERTVAQS